MSQYLCPVCRAPMNRDLSPRIPFIRHFQIALLTTSLVGLVYLLIGPYAAMKASIVYFPIWAVFEFLHWVQMREALNCKVCDFDPMLYQRDWKRARARIEQKMTKVHDNLEIEIKARIDKVIASKASSKALARTEATVTTQTITQKATQPATATKTSNASNKIASAATLKSTESTNQTAKSLKNL